MYCQRKFFVFLFYDEILFFFSWCQLWWLIPSLEEEVKTDTTQLIFYLKKKMSFEIFFSRPLIFIIFFVEYLRSGSDCTEQNLKNPNNRTCTSTNSEPKQKFRWNLIFFKNSNETFLRFLTDEFFMMILKTTMLITEFQISFGIWAKSYESVM